MNFNDHTKLYECDRQKCGKECFSGCHLTLDVRHAKNPEAYVTVAQLKSVTHKEVNQNDLQND